MTKVGDKTVAVLVLQHFNPDNAKDYVSNPEKQIWKVGVEETGQPRSPVKSQCNDICWQEVVSKKVTVTPNHREKWEMSFSAGNTVNEKMQSIVNKEERENDYWESN